MFVHSNFSIQPINHGNKTYHINKNTVKQNHMISAGFRPSKDTLSLSSHGKVNRALDGLFQLKQHIEDRKNEFISKALEEGKSGDAIQSQLEAFDEQLKSIDKQIAQIKTQQMQQKEDKEKNEKSSIYQKPKTKQEIQNERLADITNLSTGLDKAKVISSVKTSVDGNIGVLESEIELAKIRGADEKQIEKMEAKLSDMQDQSNQLTADIHEKLTETLDKIEESNDKLTDTEVLDTDKTDTDQKDHVDKEDSSNQTKEPSVSSEEKVSTQNKEEA